MIAYLSGKIIHQSAFLKKDNFVVLEAGGVGYKVFVLDRILNELKVGQNSALHIYTQVAETALDLYGFVSREELDFFELLLTISGIGPRSAMDILRKAKIADLVQAVETGNFQVLSKVSGIGPKTAEKIVLGLKDKLGGGYSGDNSVWDSGFGDALEALVSLGYSAGDAREALNQVKSQEAGEKIKEALRLLGQNR